MKIVGKTIRIFAAGLMLLALTACTSPQVRTVIVEETLDAGRMEVQNIYDNEEKMDKGYRRYLGFSNTNVLVVLEKKEQKTSLQLMDYKTGKMQSVMAWRELLGNIRSFSYQAGAGCADRIRARGFHRYWRHKPGKPQDTLGGLL